MATQKLILTTVWQQVTTGGSGFIGQCPQYDKLLICNSDSAPLDDAPAHIITEEVNLMFPAPASGEWYAKISYFTPNTPQPVLTYTEI